MANVEQSESDRERQLDAIIADYYRLSDAGGVADQNEFIQRNPDFASELEDFFSDARLLHSQDPFDPTENLQSPTIVMGRSRRSKPAAGSIVRYFGEYEILEELGAGGMGVVYKALQKKVKRIVALKMIRSGELANRSDVQRFEVEAKAAAKLSHPGIVSVHEVGIHDGRHFYTMDFVEGGNLCQLHREKPVPAKYAVKLVRQLAESMHYAHLKGIVHRDLKPANILLTTSGEPRITDFGLAKRVRDDDESQSPTMTETGQILGTAGYMSPEQASGKSRLVGPLSDVYSLGAVLYALLTSRAPFVGESPSHTIMQVLQNEPISPKKINPSVPRDLETICLRCLEKEPHKRYGTAQLLADDLQRFLEGRPVLARPISRPARVWRWCRRNPLNAGLSTIASLLLLALAIGGPVAVHIVSNKNSKLTTALENEQAANQKAVTAQAESDAKRIEANTAKSIAEQNLKLARWNTYVASFYNLTTAWKNREWGVLDRMLGDLSPRNDEPDFRGWEWYYLRDQYHRKVNVLSPDQKYILARWSPDGRQIAARREDRTIEIWSATGQLQGEIAANEGRELAWSPDSKYVASGDGLSGVGIWEVEPRLLIRTLAPQRENRKSLDGRGLDWSLDGNIVVQCGCGWIDVWNPDGTPVKSLSFGNVDEPDNYNFAINLHPTDRELAMAHRNGTVSVLDLASEQIEWRRKACDNNCLSVRWNAIGTELAVGTSYPTYRAMLFDRRGTGLHALDGHNTEIVAAAWHTDGTKLVCVGTDHHVSTWEPTSGMLIRIDHLHNGEVRDVDIRPRHSDVVTVGQDGGIRIWNIGTDFHEAQEVPTGFALAELAWSSTRPWIASPDGNSVSLIDITSGLRVKTLIGGEWPMNVVAWHPEGHLLAALNVHGEIRIWDVESEKLLNTLDAGSCGIGYSQLAWSPDGRFLASSGNESANPSQTAGVYIFDMKDFQGDKLPISIEEHYRGSVAFSPDSTRVITGDFDSKNLTLSDIATGRSIWSQESSSIVHVAYRPDGRQVAACHSDGSYGIWDAANGKQLKYVLRHTDAVVRFYWSPDGSRYVTSSLDGSIRIWDSESFDELLALDVPANRAISWSPNGSQIATGGNDGMLRIWGPKTLTLAPLLREENEIDGQVDRAYAELLVRALHEVQVDGKWVSSVDAFPPGPFAITGIRTERGSIMDDAHLKFILPRTKLAELDFADSAVSPALFQVLLTMPSLRSLSLRRSQLTDAQAVQLANRPALELLDITDSQVTQMGADKITSTHRDLIVNWNSRKHDRVMAQRFVAKNATLFVMAGQERLNIVRGQTLPEIPFRIVSIRAEEKEGLTTADFEGVEELDALETIDLTSTRLDDSVLEKFNGLPGLKALFFGDTAMKGEVLAQFETMPELFWMAANGSFANESMPHLKNFPNLEGLFLAWSDIDDAGLELLPTLNRLGNLGLDWTRVTGPGLATLARFENLEILTLTHSLLTDEGLSRLPALPKLTYLRLSELALTDMSIPHLSKFKSLTQLDLLKTSLTAEGVATLRNALPGCAINWSPPDTE